MDNLFNIDTDVFDLHIERERETGKEVDIEVDINQLDSS